MTRVSPKGERRSGWRLARQRQPERTLPGDERVLPSRAQGAAVDQREPIAEDPA